MDMGAVHNFQGIQVSSISVLVVWSSCVQGWSLRCHHKRPYAKVDVCSPRAPEAQSHGGALCGAFGEVSPLGGARITGDTVLGWGSHRGGLLQSEAAPPLWLLWHTASSPPFV